MPNIMPKTTRHKTDSPSFDANIAAIDLPSETAHDRCPANKTNVVLHKHRDVVFDNQLFKELVYTVRAEESRAELVHQSRSSAG